MARDLAVGFRVRALELQGYVVRLARLRGCAITCVIACILARLARSVLHGRFRSVLCGRPPMLALLVAVGRSLFSVFLGVRRNAFNFGPKALICVSLFGQKTSD